MMEEQTTWKGHSFTLLVFTGIVVVCSIFFILGMLVGRAQGQKFAAIAAEGNVVKAVAQPPREERPELTFFESVEKEKRPTLEPPKTESSPPAADSKPAESATLTKAVINYQIAALRKSSDASRLLDNLKKKGFRGFILGPARGDGSPFYRVQIGPFANMIEAEEAKKKLENAGYRPMLKK